MLFRKKTLFFQGKFPPACEYCQHGRPSQGEPGTYYCQKRGVVSAHYSCNAYVYDPLKREPKRRPQMPQFSPEDFQL